MTKETQDVKKHSLVVGNERIEGGIVGDWLTYEPAGPLYESDTDIGGNSFRRALHNRNIILTVNLAIGSTGIKFLSNMAEKGISLPVRFADSSTDTVLDCVECIVNLLGGVLSSNTTRTTAFTIEMMNATRQFGSLKEIV
jgi:hypothetical protein